MYFAYMRAVCMFMKKEFILILLKSHIFHTSFIPVGCYINIKFITKIMLC